MVSCSAIQTVRAFQPLIQHFKQLGTVLPPIQTVDISTTRSDMWLFIVFKKTIVGVQI